MPMVLTSCLHLFFGPLSIDKLSYFVPSGTTLDTAAQRFTTANEKLFSSCYMGSKTDYETEEPINRFLCACVLGDCFNKQGHPMS